MSLLSTLADGVGFSGATANQIVRIGDDGKIALGQNFPGGLYGHYSEFENGSAGQTGQGLNAWVTIGLANPGTARAPLTGEPGWFQCAASLETGTTATGQLMLNRTPSAVFFSSTSGLWAYEATFSIPILSDGTETFALHLGFFSASFVNAASPFQGITLAYRFSVNSGKFQLITAQGGTVTAVDTGVTAVAGNYYHMRIEYLNNTLASMFLKTTFAGSVWADNGVWTTPVATSSTNLPTGTAQPCFGGAIIIKSLGTTSRKIKIGHQVLTRDFPFSSSAERTRFMVPGKLSGGDGIGAAVIGAKGTALAISPSGLPTWRPPLRIAHPITYLAYGRGGWVTSPPHDFGFVATGGSIAGSTLDNGMPFGVNVLSTGGTPTGFCTYHASTAVTIDASVQPLVFECVFNLTQLSTIGQQCVAQLGFVNNLTIAPTSGVWIEIDSVANVAAQCKCSQGGVATTTTSGLTIAALTNYLLRIVITSTTVNFWIKPDDGSAFGAPTVTISSNIPTDTLAPAVIQRNLLGTTSHTLKLSYALAFSRSST